MSERISVNVLTGFLGSGKTSLLNRLLRDPLFSNCAVLINEFGDIGIDHHLVGAIEGDVVLLPSGCICCTIRGDLSAAMRDLYDRRDRGEVPAFTRLVVETTGLADPTLVLSTVKYDRVLQHHFRIGTVITTVDLVNGQLNLERFPECQKQVALADRLVITKLDIADSTLLPVLCEKLAQVNPSAPFLLLDPLSLDAIELMGGDVFDLSSKSEEVNRWLEAPVQRHYFSSVETQESAQPANAHRGILAFALDLTESIDWTVFSVWLSLLLEAHGERVLRVKGLLNVEGSDTPVVIHGVQQMMHPPSHLERWPDDSRHSKLIFIVKDLAHGVVEKSLKAFLNEYSLVHVHEPNYTPI